MATNWTAKELGQLSQAHQAKVCGFNPRWGKCAHPQCKALWGLTPETATPAERAAIWPLLQGAQIEVEVASAPAGKPHKATPLFA